MNGSYSPHGRTGSFADEEDSGLLQEQICKCLVRDWLQSFLKGKYKTGYDQKRQLQRSSGLASLYALSFVNDKAAQLQQQSRVPSTA
jgi:hypothetical protein